MEAIARVDRREMAQVEANHASIRRALRLNSVQTHGVLFQHISAQITTQQMRKLRSRLRPGFRQFCKQTKARVVAKALPDGDDPQEKNKTGGPWRAYVREHTLGCKGRPDLAAVAAAYRELSQEELARLRSIGEQGKRARDAGAAHTFGETTIDATRRTNKRRRQLAIESLAEAPSVRPSLYSAKEIAVVTGSAQDLLAAAQPSSLAVRLGFLKQDLMLQASAGRLRHQRDTDELVKLIDAQAAGPFVAAHRISHSLRERGCEVVPERASGKLRVFSWSPCQVPVRVARALSIKSRPTRMLLQALSKK